MPAGARLRQAQKNSTPADRRSAAFFLCLPRSGASGLAYRQHPLPVRSAGALRGGRLFRLAVFLHLDPEPDFFPAVVLPLSQTFLE